MAKTFEFEHDPVYSDVEELAESGCWPEHFVPAWVRERADAWGCSETSGIIIETAMKFEIERLNKVVEIYKNALLNIKKLGRVCPEFMICNHSWCSDSAGAWIEADEALRKTKGTKSEGNDG